LPTAWSAKLLESFLEAFYSSVSPQQGKLRIINLNFFLELNDCTSSVKLFLPLMPHPPTGPRRGANLL